MTTRTQLSLFVPPEFAEPLEAVRRLVDPVQSRLIPAHVTLCREDEFTAEQIEAIASRLRESPPGALTLQFGAPERFHEHGMLLPCIGGEAAFHALRQMLLAPQVARPHAAHMTLAHPRNPRVPANSLQTAESLKAGMSITFGTVHVIDQVDGGPWVVRRTFSLTRRALP